MRTKSTFCAKQEVGSSVAVEFLACRFIPVSRAGEFLGHHEVEYGIHSRLTTLTEHITRTRQHALLFHCVW